MSLTERLKQPSTGKHLPVPSRMHEKIGGFPNAQGFTERKKPTDKSCPAVEGDSRTGYAYPLKIYWANRGEIDPETIHTSEGEIGFPLSNYANVLERGDIETQDEYFSGEPDVEIEEVRAIKIVDTKGELPARKDTCMSAKKTGEIYTLAIGMPLGLQQR